MPTVEKPQLTLTRNGEKVTIEVKYTAIFSKLERRLVGLGLVFEEQIAVIGVDPPGGTIREVLKIDFPPQSLPVTDGQDPLTITRTRSLVVDRTQLQEDPMVGDTDEICCRIRIAAIGLPPGVTPDVFTNEQALFG